MSVPTAIVVARNNVSKYVATTTMPWWRVLLVRVARTYVQSLLGLTATILVAPQTPISVGAPYYVLAPVVGAFVLALQWALAPAVVALLHNVYELLTKLDQTAPEWRA